MIVRSKLVSCLTAFLAVVGTVVLANLAVAGAAAVPVKDGLASNFGRELTPTAMLVHRHETEINGKHTGQNVPPAGCGDRAVREHFGCGRVFHLPGTGM
jgi:hypothetical protein